MLRAARNEPARLVIGIDADASSMRPAARRASRSGLANAVFVVAAVESLPAELMDAADRVTISFPWGSLLRGLFGTGDGIVPSVSRICRAGAEVTAVWSLTARDAMVAPDPNALIRRLAIAGLEVVELHEASPEEIEATGSSWAKRLGVGRRRPATILRARKTVT